MHRTFRKQEFQKIYAESLRQRPPVERRPPGFDGLTLDAKTPTAVVGLVLRSVPESFHVSKDDEPLFKEFLLTARSQALLQHPGQVCLPGGLVESGEAERPLAALDRELREEVGIPEGLVEWNPQSWDSIISIHGLRVFPFLGFLAPTAQALPTLQLAADEVADAEWLSLSALFDAQLWEIQEIRGTKLPVWKGWSHRTWGMTAILLAIFYERILGVPPIEGLGSGL